MSYNRWLKGFCFFLSLTIVLSLFPKTLKANDVTVDYYSAIENCEFEVDVSINSAWGNHANLDFTITNTGNEKIDNWYITFDLAYSIENIWGAQFFETNGAGVYTIKNMGFNQDIQPGQSVNFGMTVASSGNDLVSEYPSFYLLNTRKALVESSSYFLSYQEYSNWEAGFNGALLITNKAGDAIEDWQISFSSNRVITNVSNAELSLDEDSIIIDNNGSNQNINPYSTLNLTVVGSEMNTSSAMVMQDVAVYSVSCAFGLSEDIDQNGIADYRDFMNGQTVGSEVSPTPTATSSPTETPTDTPTPTVMETPAPTPTTDPELDTDGDGIPDSVEIELGTDLYSPDSDDDGIDDGLEVQMGLDPTSDDSDGDGVPDGQEDDDGDGLTFLEELEHETYTWLDDSDVDDLSDTDEINRYGTDPLNEDTDGDGIADGDEVKLGTDPLVPDSDGDGVPDGEERFLQTRDEEISNSERPVVNKVEVTLEGTGCLESAMTIKDVYGIDKYSSSLFGLVGVPTEIEYEGDFDEATITFCYSEDLLASTMMNSSDTTYSEETKEEDLGILWFDEENGVYVDCDAVVDEEHNKVSCQVTHFSRYMLYNKTAWDYRWNYELEGVSIPTPTSLDANGNVRGKDYFLMFQYDASMTDEQKNAQHDFIFSVIDNMEPNDRVQFLCMADNWLVGPYEEGIGFVPVSDKQTAKDVYDNLLWTDPVYPTSWCSFGSHCIVQDLGWIYLMTRTRDSNMGSNGNEVVTICMANAISSSDYALPVYQTYRNMSDNYLYSDYVVLLPGGVIEYPKLNLWDQWGGSIIEWDKVDDAYQAFCDCYAARQGKDEDGDGLWDIHEISGMVGSNGVIYYSDPSIEDTDGDGLPDGEEMGTRVEVQITAKGELFLDGVQVEPTDFKSMLRYGRFLLFGTGRWTVYSVKSDPNNEDTDGDGAWDDIDATPFDENGTISYIMIGMDDPFEDTLERMRNPYIKAFESKGIDVVVLDMWEGSDFDKKVEAYAKKSVTITELTKFVFDHLNQDLSRENLADNNGKISYKSVDVCVIIAHCSSNVMQFQGAPLGSAGQINILQIHNSIHPVCEIDTLDIQGCYSGLDVYDGTLGYETCLAREFMITEKVRRTYAWTGESSFDNLFTYTNFSTNGEYVVFYRGSNGGQDAQMFVIGQYCVDPLLYVN